MVLAPGICALVAWGAALPVLAAFPPVPSPSPASTAAPVTAAPVTKPDASPAGPGAARLEGQPDGSLQVRVGSAIAARIVPATPALRQGVARLRTLRIAGHAIADVRIPVRGRPTEEVWIGEVGAGRPARVIWSGLTGPQDVDEETALWVDVTPERIFQYQTAAQVSRCDGQPVRLFPRAWDFDSGRFRPILSTPPDPAPVERRLIAHRGDPAMPTSRPISGFHFTSASTSATAGTDARALSAPAALDDGDPATAWSEGLGGDGRGEFLTARASSDHDQVRGLRIVPGDASTRQAFRSRNRIKSLFVALGPEPERQFDVQFPSDPALGARDDAAVRAPYWVALPRPVDASCLTIVLRDVYRGTASGPADGGGTTALSDVEVFTQLDGPEGIERLVAAIAAGGDCPSRVPALVAAGTPAVEPAAKAILAGAVGVGRACLVEALSRIPGTEEDGPARQALAGALVGATDGEERLIIETLRRGKSERAAASVVSVQSLLLSASAAAADRARAARALAGLGRPEAATALLAAAGSDPTEVRLAVVQALGQSPLITAPLVAGAIETARAAPGEAARRREADLLRVLPTLAERPGADRAAIVAVTRRSLAVSPSFEVRARAIMALGALGLPAAAGGAPSAAGPALVTDLAHVRESCDDPVLRFLAARELGSVGGTVSLTALRSALGDRDPRVREAAAVGLGQRRDALSEAVLIRAAKDEPWPFARRAQVEALSHTCGAPARALLARAMERDVDDVRRVALVGLVRCHDERARGTLLATLKNHRGDASLRALSAALLGELGDRGAAADLAATLGDLVNEAEGDLAIEGVATAALRALARLGGGDAARAAGRMATDAAHPAYRRAAIESLGQICDPQAGAQALAAVRAGPDPALAAEAQKAAQRCP